ncbi:hypothetical protein AMELA_G00112100 [Ameiurus melas]|uniref:Uncharacterized protein n=1 Tax=Ameiurus melas TaxID=219545 RepID=A0A7J6ATW1_AMEME|nr:hypothetical protein AMELA_G00112100 [Ameiurus melas]
MPDVQLSICLLPAEPNQMSIVIGVAVVVGFLVVVFIIVSSYNVFKRNRTNIRSHLKEKYEDKIDSKQTAM